MPSKLRLMSALIAALMTASCASSAPPVIAPQKPLPAAALQLCAEPPPAPGGGVDEVADALHGMYGLYGQCAGLHADLVRAVEGARK